MNSYRRQLLAAILLLGILSACTAARPDWIEGKSAPYDEQKFLTGVGCDSRRQPAEDRARAQLAKIFQVNIQAQDEISESSLLSRLGEANREEYTQSASSRLETSTDQVLRGVQIAELFHDDKNSQFCALATLDRVSATRELSEELAAIDTAVTQLVSMARQSDSPPIRLGYYLRAVEANRTRPEVAAKLRIVDPAGWSTPAKYHQPELIAAAEQTAKAINIVVEIRGDEQGIVTGAVVRALNATGMNVVSSGGDITLHGQVAIEEYQREGTNWAVSTAQVEFITASGGRLDALRAKAREASQVKNLAALLAAERLGDKLAGLLIQRIARLGE